MNLIAYETAAGMSLFKDELLDSFILHIPHASTHIPSLEGFVLGKLEENMRLLTDWATDRIFDVPGLARIITPYSRLFCDVERFGDEHEPMLEVGRGFYYTHGYDGSELRELDVARKEAVRREFYLKHHERLADMARERLAKHGVCHVLDCHSFNDAPLVPFHAAPKSPDICIGTDPFHTPDHWKTYTLNYFTRFGYSVEINDPYAGCIIPKPYYLRDSRVKGLMIEINKRLYMDVVNEERVGGLRRVMQGYFEEL